MTMRLYAAWLSLDSSARRALARLLALIVWIQVANRFFPRGFDRAFATAVALFLVAGIFKETRALIKGQQSEEVGAVHSALRIFRQAALGVCTFLELLVAAAALCVSFR